MSRKRLDVVSFRFALALGTAALAQPWLSGAAQAAPQTITSGTQLRDTSGNVVHAHGGGVIKVGEYYYWFGENRATRYVDVYRSTDLARLAHPTCTWATAGRGPGAGRSTTLSMSGCRSSSPATRA